MFEPGLKKGEVIDNKNLREIFKCSPQGGMRRSHKTNTLVIISNRIKSIYEDKWIDGVLHYTGMGQVGDQDRGYSQNYTLYHSDRNGVAVFLFEVLQQEKYTYRGRVELVDEPKPYTQTQLDRYENPRNVWIFPVKVVE